MSVKNPSKKEALFWLGYLRAGSPYWIGHIHWLKEKLKDARLRLQDVGSSEAELSEFVIKGGKASAVFHLGLLRNGKLNWDNRKVCRDKIYEGLQLASLTFGDIGCTKEEFENLVNRDRVLV
jgi:hypothetical protein